MFTKQEVFEIVGYSDSDYNSDLDRRRSVSAYLFQVGGNTVSWRATLSSVVRYQPHKLSIWLSLKQLRRVNG